MTNGVESPILRTGVLLAAEQVILPIERSRACRQIHEPSVGIALHQRDPGAAFWAHASDRAHRIAVSGAFDRTTGAVLRFARHGRRMSPRASGSQVQPTSELDSLPVLLPRGSRRTTNGLSGGVGVAVESRIAGVGRGGLDDTKSPPFGGLFCPLPVSSRAARGRCLRCQRSLIDGLAGWPRRCRRVPCAVPRRILALVKWRPPSGIAGMLRRKCQSVAVDVDPIP